MTETSLILAPAPAFLEPSLNQTLIEMGELALAAAALIGKVENAAENKAAVDAQKGLKEFCRIVEKERVRLNEPALEYSRALMRCKEKAVLDKEQEYGRISNLVSDFQLKERRRVAEEQRKQQEELDRIERERQEELKRIADEQARVELEAKEAREAAERLASEAKSKKQREAAATAQADAKRLADAAQVQAATAQAQSAKVEEKAAEAAYIESRPIVSTKASGQRVVEDWEIQVVNPYELARLHPECVRVEPLLTPIKAALNAGRTINGITFKKIVVSGVRATGRRVVEV